MRLGLRRPEKSVPSAFRLDEEALVVCIEKHWVGALIGRWCEVGTWLPAGDTRVLARPDLFAVRLTDLGEHNSEAAGNLAPEDVAPYRQDPAA